MIALYLEFILQQLEALLVLCDNIKPWLKCILWKHRALFGMYSVTTLIIVWNLFHDIYKHCLECILWEYLSTVWNTVCGSIEHSLK